MAGTPGRNVRVPVDLRDRVRAKCGEMKDSNATLVVSRALREFVHDPLVIVSVLHYGQTHPPGRAETVQISYRIDDVMWEAAQRRCDQLQGVAARTGVVLTASLVAVWGLDRFAPETDKADV
jgi:hypothetical protein